MEAEPKKVNCDMKLNGLSKMSPIESVSVRNKQNNVGPENRPRVCHGEPSSLSEDEFFGRMRNLQLMDSNGIMVREITSQKDSDYQFTDEDCTRLYSLRECISFVSDAPLLRGKKFSSSWQPIAFALDVVRLGRVPLAMVVQTMFMTSCDSAACP
ncbi:hypothetical protein NC653_023077 [Populus alba x Populus x berolinensis]|uniref:Uncharacterized protein n=1 Tax=Populus alba x Populus x berolinensis TaxID=444605 RepID=A0AAD6MGA2_9ROSI|nr:hypothetical protein NC653_023077 [Populus alba x Populus x berolinensis]